MENYVYYRSLTSNNDKDVLIGNFLSKVDADSAFDLFAKLRKPINGNEFVNNTKEVSLQIYSSFDEYWEVRKALLKQSALSKLSDEEKYALDLLK